MYAKEADLFHGAGSYLIHWAVYWLVKKFPALMEVKSMTVYTRGQWVCLVAIACCVNNLRVNAVENVCSEDSKVIYF
jgi:hypothetical protein